MKTITIYNINQFKNGKLKKKAQSEMGLSFVDVLAKDEKEAEKQRKEFNEYTAKTIKQRGYHNFESPYIFTHIDCLNSNNERCILFEHIIIGSDNKEIITSPVKLLVELKK